MYSKIFLTNKNRVPLALENEQFDNCFILVEDIKRCNGWEEALSVINSHDPLIKFTYMSDTSEKSIFSRTDRLGNVNYLVCTKVPGSERVYLEDIIGTLGEWLDSDLGDMPYPVIEAIKKAYDIATKYL